MNTVYLADTSALARLDRPEVAERLAPLIVDGRVAVCGTVMLEVLFSAISKRAYAETSEMLGALPRAPIDDDVIDRALETQAVLARSSQHRGIALPDLILAAAAANAELIVLHYDSDFERIAAITGQSVEWVVSRGSVD
ncbi:MAG TPA: PIN domain-containing protein [Solirubrobacterales bacterium]|nr:PIN domain-containing protein [Solirubrobacterales bacterium]